MTSAFIHDGMTRRGYISESKHQYPAVRFTYRPMLVQNRAVVFRQIADCKDPRKEQELAARVIAAQVQEWDITSDNGGAVPVDDKAALRLEPNLFGRLFEIVTGSRVTDEDPAWVDDDREQRERDELAAALSNGQSATLLESTREKNSDAG